MEWWWSCCGSWFGPWSFANCYFSTILPSYIIYMLTQCNTMSGPRNTIPPLLQYPYQITRHMMARSLRDRPARGLEQFPELLKYMTTGPTLMKLMKKGKKMIKLTLKQQSGQWWTLLDTGTGHNMLWFIRVSCSWHVHHTWHNICIVLPRVSVHTHTAPIIFMSYNNYVQRLWSLQSEQLFLQYINSTSWCRTERAQNNFPSAQ